MSTPLIRSAAADDLADINHIYNHYVLHSTTTYQVEPETPQGRAAWFARHGPQHPVIVAEVDGEVAGWGSLSAYHSRAAYARTVEDSIYIRHDRQRQGLGSAILARLIDLAQQIGHHTIIAAIDADQRGSIALHRRFGFDQWGHVREVGFKFGRWLDVVYLQRML